MESVWSYPQGPVFEVERRLVRVEHGGMTLAETSAAIRVLERGLPPSYYIPPEHVRMDVLVPGEGTSLCPVKGRARFFTLRSGERDTERAAWSYPEPLSGAEPIRDHVCFDVNRVDRCLVGGEVARGRDNPFYGGWVTGDLEGPFVGDPDLPADLVRLLPRPVISQDPDESFEDVAARSVSVGSRFLPPA
jgi:uncharacterized protein (DUF427 family)